MKKNIAKVLLVLSLGFAVQAQAAAPSFDLTGDFVVSFELGGTTYAHDLSLTQDGSGNLTGFGGYPAGGSHVYSWVLDSGTVSGSDVEFTAHYTASADAVTPLTVMHVTGTVGSDGSMSGSWSDNYQNGNRVGTWATLSGAAVVINSAPTNKDQCKNNGWKTFTNPSFKNQGQCVSSVVSHR